MPRGTGTLSGDEARSQLYDVMRTDAPMEERVRRALELGTEYFGVEHGYVARIDQATDDWKVYISIDPDGGAVKEGLNADYSTTYCRRTIEEEGVVSFHDGPDAALEANPEFQSHGVYCYHGAPVIIDGEAFGTVCFASTEARTDPFSDAERAFTDLVASMVGHEIEREQRRTALDERERELEKRQEIYRAVIDASFDIVFRVDTDGTFTYNSPATEAVLGYPPERLVGQEHTALFADSELEQQTDDLFERVLAGETVETSALPMETADGSIVYVDVRATPVYDASVPDDEQTPEDVVAVQGMAHDATERERRERLNRVLNRVLRHNLRNDVGVVRGYAETLADRLSGEQRELVERIRTTADRLLELGDTARRLEDHMERPPEVEPLDVVDFVADSVDQFRDQHPAASVSLSAPEEAVAETAPQFKTALWELLDNAGRHAGPEPTVEVSVAVADSVVVTITDDGPGLPEDERAVLDTGEETPLVHGSGLGLWLVRWIVTSLDGEVTVAETDTGSRFEIRLPRPDW